MKLAVGTGVCLIVLVLWRALSLESGEFLSGFLGSAGGVWLAFWIQRRHEDQQATARYAAQLYACHQELIELRERGTCQQERDSGFMSLV